MMVHARRVLWGHTADDLRADALIQKLRDVVLNGREKNMADRKRAVLYNLRNRRRGLSFRAPVR